MWSMIYNGVIDLDVILLPLLMGVKSSQPHLFLLVTICLLQNTSLVSLYMFNEDIQNIGVGNMPGRMTTSSLCVNLVV